MYMANGFRILAHGDHVICAKSGAVVSLEALRYWNVTKQEPYATAEIAARAAIGE
jgi:hypothetical protein